MPTTSLRTQHHWRVKVICAETQSTQDVDVHAYWDPADETTPVAIGEAAVARVSGKHRTRTYATLEVALLS